MRPARTLASRATHLMTKKMIGKVVLDAVDSASFNVALRFGAYIDTSVIVIGVRPSQRQIAHTTFRFEVSQ